MWICCKLVCPIKVSMINAQLTMNKNEITIGSTYSDIALVGVNEWHAMTTFQQRHDCLCHRVLSLGARDNLLHDFSAHSALIDSCKLVEGLAHCGQVVAVGLD